MKIIKFSRFSQRLQLDRKKREQILVKGRFKWSALNLTVMMKTLSMNAKSVFERYYAAVTIR